MLSTPQAGRRRPRRSAELRQCCCTCAGASRWRLRRASARSQRRRGPFDGSRQPAAAPRGPRSSSAARALATYEPVRTGTCISDPSNLSRRPPALVLPALPARDPSGNSHHDARRPDPPQARGRALGTQRQRQRVWQGAHLLEAPARADAAAVTPSSATAFAVNGRLAFLRATALHWARVPLVITANAGS